MLNLDPIERVSFTLSAGAAVAAYAFATPQFATGVVVGAALEALNLRAQVKASRALFAGRIAGSGPWIGGFGMRFGLMAVAIVAVLSVGVDAAGLLVGFSLAMPAVVFWAWRNRPPVLEHAPAPAVPADDPSWDRWSVWRAEAIEAPVHEDDDDRGEEVGSV